MQEAVPLSARSKLFCNDVAAMGVSKLDSSRNIQMSEILDKNSRQVEFKDKLLQYENLLKGAYFQNLQYEMHLVDENHKQPSSILSWLPF